MPENIFNTELRSEEVQEILETTPIWMIRWGNILVLSLILMLLFISWFVKYPDVIAANVIITTEFPPQKEYAKTSGKITSILIGDGQLVNGNTPLAVIESTANFDDVYFLKSIIDTVALNNANFEFPVDNIPVLSLGEVESEYALFVNNYLQYQLNKQYRPFSFRANANRITTAQLQLQLRTLESQKQINQAELELQKKDLERNKKLFDDSVISAQAYESSELSYLQAERNSANMNASISQVKDAINNANSASKETHLNGIREDISLFKNVIQSFNQLKRAIKDWELRYVLKSGIDGTVVYLNDWKVNQTVNQNDLIFTIIPKESSTYIAQLKSPAQNSGKLKVGQTVNIKLETYPDTEFGTLKGTLQNISLLPDNDGFYLIKTALPQQLITSYNKEILFKHEMNGTAEIITDDLRLIERFFYRFKSILKE